MNYNQPELCRALAGEYVLGSLTGAARRRYERLCASENGQLLVSEQRIWEAHLATLALRLQPVKPSETAWANLRHRLGLPDEAGAPRSQINTPTPKKIRRVRTWAWLATAASVILAVVLAFVLTHGPVPSPSYVAYLQVPKSSMHWTVSLSRSPHRIRVAAAGTPPPSVNGKDAELWWIGANGKPVALGVLPKSGKLSRSYPNTLSIGAGGKLAVSIEPLGGSPTGQPTGPVILTAPVALSG